MKKVLAVLAAVGMFLTGINSYAGNTLTVEEVKQFKYDFWQHHKQDYDEILAQAKNAGQIFVGTESYETLKRFEEENDPNIAPLKQEELEALYQAGIAMGKAFGSIVSSVTDEEKEFMNRQLQYSLENKLLKPMSLDAFTQMYVAIVEKYAMENELSKEERDAYEACAQYMPFIIYKVKRQKENEKVEKGKYYEIFLKTPETTPEAQWAV